MNRARLALLVAVALVLAAGEVAPEDPPLCRAAIEAQPDPSALETLAAAEKDAYQRAREASRAAKRASKHTLGGGNTGANRGHVMAAGEAVRVSGIARREAKTYCYCRQRRGDPYREDCEQLYPEVLR